MRVNLSERINEVRQELVVLYQSYVSTPVIDPRLQTQLSNLRVIFNFERGDFVALKPITDLIEAMNQKIQNRTAIAGIVQSLRRFPSFQENPAQNPRLDVATRQRYQEVIKEPLSINDIILRCQNYNYYVELLYDVMQVVTNSIAFNFGTTELRRPETPIQCETLELAQEFFRSAQEKLKQLLIPNLGLGPCWLCFKLISNVGQFINREISLSPSETVAKFSDLKRIFTKNPGASKRTFEIMADLGWKYCEDMELSDLLLALQVANYVIQ